MVRRRGDESGAATTELVVVFPALLLLVLLTVHVGLWFHAGHVASAAAQEGARAARLEGATGADGDAAAHALLDQLGRKVLTERGVKTTTTGDTVRVEVTGWAVEVVPRLRLRVSEVSEAPVERFRPSAAG